MDAADASRARHEAYHRRGWKDAKHIHPEASVEMPATGERLEGRDETLRFRQDYPEPRGTFAALRALGGANEAAVEVRVHAPDGQRLPMAAFWQARDGRLCRGVEYWVTVGAESPPPGRRAAFPRGQGLPVQGTVVRRRSRRLARPREALEQRGKDLGRLLAPDPLAHCRKCPSSERGLCRLLPDLPHGGSGAQWGRVDAVLHPGHGRELPAEQVLGELAGALRIRRRELDVREAAGSRSCHARLPPRTRREATPAGAFPVVPPEPDEASILGRDPSSACL